MAETNGPLRIRDAIPDECPITVGFNRLLALETEHKVMDPVILEQGVPRESTRPLLRYNFPVRVAVVKR